MFEVGGVSQRLKRGVQPVDEVGSSMEFLYSSGARRRVFQASISGSEDEVKA